MKAKWLMLALSILLSLSVVVGCGSNDNADAQQDNNNNAAEDNSNNEEPANNDEENEEETGMYEDGFYFARADENIDGDWRYWVAIEVENGFIADVEWNATARAGFPDKLAHAASGEYGMIKASTIDKEWHEQAEAAAEYLIEVQDPTLIEVNEDKTSDAIAGATIKVNDFVDLAEKALAAGPVTAGSYKDGFYIAEEEVDEDAEWQYFASVIVRNGNIVDAVFNAYNTAGGDHKIKHAASGEYGMIKASAIEKEWHEQAAATVDYLLEIQDPAKAELNDEGRSDAISGASIKVGVFFDLVDQALAGAK